MPKEHILNSEYRGVPRIQYCLALVSVPIFVLIYYVCLTHMNKLWGDAQIWQPLILLVNCVAESHDMMRELSLKVVWVGGSHTSILTAYLKFTGLFTLGVKFSSNLIHASTSSLLKHRYCTAWCFAKPILHNPNIQMPRNNWNQCPHQKRHDNIDSMRPQNYIHKNWSLLDGASLPMSLSFSVLGWAFFISALRRELATL